MSDPFDALRSSVRGASGDVGAIKARARRIDRRRRVALSSSAVVIAGIAVAGVLLRPGSGPQQLAQKSQATPLTTATSEFAARAAASPPAAAPAPGAAVTTGQTRAQPA